jgi:hypothetical protein
VAGRLHCGDPDQLSASDYQALQKQLEAQYRRIVSSTQVTADEIVLPTRMAARILSGERGDPHIDKKILVEVATILSSLLATNKRRPIIELRRGRSIPNRGAIQDQICPGSN